METSLTPTSAPAIEETILLTRENPAPMARQSSDREDLMAEAIALLPRIQLQLLNTPGEIVAGQRVDGRWSIFFDGDPVYQFDAQHRLRRAFVAGRLYRTQGQTLARLTRQESSAETVLFHHDLSDVELAAFLQQMLARLKTVARAVEQHQIQVDNQVPEHPDYLPVLAAAIDGVLQSDNLLAPPIVRR